VSTFRVVHGMRDMLPEDLEKRRHVVDVIRNMFRVYSYDEVETPVIESFDLLSAKAGDEIRHRMYVFTDLGGRKVALRPEMTAPVARIVAMHMRTKPKPLRLGYIANCFRYDNPQMGRYREFWQAGFELFGSSRPETDVETLTISTDLMERLGFRNYSFKIGHVGILRGVLSQEGVSEENQGSVMGLIDKGKHSMALELLMRLNLSKQGLEAVKKLLQLKGKNINKVLSNGEKVLSNYEAGYKALVNLKDILSLLAASEIKVPITVDLGFARGLEYYTGMIFEVYAPKMNIALNGGGRYDKLIELFGGEPTPAVGCAPGIDRIVLAMKKKALFPKKVVEKRILVVPVNDKLNAKASAIASQLRRVDFQVETEVLGKGIKKALSYANAKDHAFVVIVAPKELTEGNVIIRDMRRAVQQEVPMDRVTEVLRKSLATLRKRPLTKNACFLDEAV